jgi:hypothetical protein
MKESWSGNSSKVELFCVSTPLVRLIDVFSIRSPPIITHEFTVIFKYREFQLFVQNELLEI